MILKRKELKDYLSIELMYKKTLKNILFPPPNYIFVKWLRIYEFFYNNRSNLFLTPFLLWAYFQYYRYSLKCGLSIPKNVCAKGLTLYHFGSIVINPSCVIGENCCIMNNVNIGANNGSCAAPQIGNNVYIGPGAVIFGDIKIADGCYIGANSVVNKNILEPNSVVVGVPAKIIKKDTECWWKKNRLMR